MASFGRRVLYARRIGGRSVEAPPVNPSDPGDGTTDPPPPPPPPPGHNMTPTPNRPWDMAYDELRAAHKGFGVHMMANWRVSIDDKGPSDATEYFKRVWEPPGAVEGGTDHRKYGGFIRNRPLRRPTIGGSSTPGAGGWTLADKRWELRQLAAAGIFTIVIDILDSATWEHGKEYAQAAQLEGWPDECIVAMSDAGASIVRYGPQNHADKLAQAFAGPYAAKWRRVSATDRRWLVMPFGPELACERVFTLSAAITAGATITALPVKTLSYDEVKAGTVLKLNNGGQLVTVSATVKAGATSIPVNSVKVATAQAVNATLTQQATDAETSDYWLRFHDAMAAKGLPAGLAPCHTRSMTDTAQRTDVFRKGGPLDAHLVMRGRWGVGDVASTNSQASELDAQGALLPFVYTARLNDSRPDQGVFTESQGWENLRALFKVLSTRKARVGFLQWATGNDWREGSSVMPSTMQGYAPLDVLSYYLHGYLLGWYPPIVRDGLYYCHRKQQTPTYGAQPSYAASSLTGGVYTKFQARTGSTPEENKVEVLVFAVAPAQVTIRVGSAAPVVASVPAGESRVNAPLAPGTVSVELARAGTVVTSVTSPYPVSFTSADAQNMDYCRGSNLRDRSILPTRAP